MERYWFIKNEVTYMSVELQVCFTVFES